MAKAKKEEMEMACYDCGSCNCPHHKVMPGLKVLITGAVLYYTANWGLAVMTLGAMILVGMNLCKCCSGEDCGGCC